ncbi:MAG TPA: SMP-30/gluconolactonase/LRE family protein [Candidatus Methylacidiphilales bacterium]|nr:SMP-30/gluconolactonase/LRE family protein [Candidatus Methylacidiphilales bacterium]
MLDEPVSTVKKVIAPPAAPQVLVEEAGKLAQNLWWDDRDESLWWTDTEGKRIYRLKLDTRIQSAVYEGPAAGAFLPCEDGAWLLFRDRDVALLDFDRHPQVTPLIENVRVDGDHFNGAIADAAGRALVGTVRTDRPNGAGLYRLENAGTLAKIVGGTGFSGGMGWNEKGDALYWSCSTTKTIWRFRYDAKRGSLTNRQVFHECQPGEGTPTGLAIDTGGTLWSARREAGVILKIADDRRLMGQVTFPAKHVTSIAFGGSDLRTVFVSALVEEGCSKIFMLQSAVAGLPLRRAKIDPKA